MRNIKNFNYYYFSIKVTDREIAYSETVKIPYTEYWSVREESLENARSKLKRRIEERVFKYYEHSEGYYAYEYLGANPLEINEITEKEFEDVNEVLEFKMYYI